MNKAELAKAGSINRPYYDSVKLLNNKHLMQHLVVNLFQPAIIWVTGFFGESKN
jgi:hypothetical protein